MKKGFLSEYFQGVAAKRLSAVEIDAQISHQHEFNGVNGLKKCWEMTDRPLKPHIFIFQNQKMKPLQMKAP